jgi:hypothetical protein
MRIAMLNRQFWHFGNSRFTGWLPFTFMLAGISPSNFFTARAAEHLPKRWSSGRKLQKNNQLSPIQQRLTLASQLLYHELE